MVVQIALYRIGIAFEAGPLFFPPQPSLCGLQRLAGAWLTINDRRHTSAAPHRATENDMHTITAALAAASLLVGSAAAMAQATRAPQANPFERQGATPATPTNPSPQPAPRTASSQPGATTAGANQFQSEGAAKQACGADTVVWANTSGSKAWHVSGDKYYGHTKRGAFMCQQAAQQAGYHPSGGAVRAQRAGTRTQ